MEDMPPPTSMLSETLPPSMVMAVRLPAPMTLTVNSALNCETVPLPTVTPGWSAASCR